jgi:sugar phosphate permease
MDTQETEPLQSSPATSWRAWPIFALGCLAFGYAFFQRVTPSTMVADLMRSFDAGAAVLGNLSALYFYAYAGLQVPIGSLVDKWGARIMLSLSMLLAGLGSLIFSIASGIEIAYLGRVLVGIGSAVAFVGTLALAARWFPVNRFAFLSGVTMFCGLSAGVVGQGPLASLVLAYGWREIMFTAGIFALCLSIAIWLVVRNSPSELSMGRSHEVKPQSDHSLLQNFRETLKNREVWAIGMIAMACSGPMLAFGALWGVPYLSARYGLARPEAAGYTSLLLIGFACGAPLSGWVSDSLRLRKLPLIVATAVNIIFVIFLFYGPTMPLSVAAILIFLLGFNGSAMASTYAFAKESSPVRIHGAVTGLVNMMTVGAGAILQPIIGVHLEYLWDGATEDGVPVYSAAMYETAFFSILVIAGCGLLAAAFTRETHCRQRSF